MSKYQKRVAFQILNDISKVPGVQLDAAQKQYYVIIRGDDDLWKISQRTSVPVKTLVELNPNANLTRLSEGDRIWLTENPDSWHTSRRLEHDSHGRFITIQPGDSPWKIHFSANVSYEDIVEANPEISNFYNLPVGYKLRLR